MTDAEILVILPTLGNRIELLKQTLESVVSQKNDIALTLVVVVPKGAVEARKLAEDSGALLLDDPGTGISAAINVGLTARRGEEFYAWIGDDDIFRDGGLLILKELLEKNDSAVLAYGGCDYIDPSGKILLTSKAGWFAKFLLPWGPDLIPHPGTMIRLDALNKIGGFDETLHFAMDLDAFLRLRRHGSFVSTKKTVSAFRWHPESLTVANRSHSSAEAEKVKNSHLPRVLRRVSFLWNVPVRIASRRAAAHVSARAR